MSDTVTVFTQFGVCRM